MNRQPVIYRIRPEICERAVREDILDRRRLTDETIERIRASAAKTGEEWRNVAGLTLERAIEEIESSYRDGVLLAESYLVASVVYFPRGRAGLFRLRGSWYLTYGTIEDRSFEALSKRDMTGHFDSGEKAYDWYVTGGR